MSRSTTLGDLTWRLAARACHGRSTRTVRANVVVPLGREPTSATTRLFRKAVVNLARDQGGQS